MAHVITRRRFLQSTAATAALAAAGPAVFSKSPNEKLNIACVGVGGRGGADLGGVMSQNIVAICDIDDRNLGQAAKRVPDAQTFTDYRIMLDKVANQIDAVVCGTPDHTHGPVAASAILLGKHVYCEKPLCHNVFEVRVVTELARKYKVATQLGTQIHAEDNYRRVVELIKAGAIGPVRHAHVWVGKSWANGRLATKAQPVPPYLHWDLWAGVAPVPPYANGVYHPANWRKFWDYGTGTLGDMGCHFTDVVFWALDLKFPTSVESDCADPPHPVGTPHALGVHYQFPARGDMPACHVTWHDGGRQPDLVAQGKVIVGGKPQRWGSGVLFVGDKGMLLCDYGRRHLLPEEQFKDYKAPDPSIPKSIGHHNEWIKAAKDGSPTTCNFAYSGPLSETILLGNVAFRTGKRIEWDGPNLKVTNAPNAAQFIRRQYRKGWPMPGTDVIHYA